VPTRAISVENTHNFGGGAVIPLDELRALRTGADDRGVGVHLDGARLWNAHVATGIPLADYGREFDTVSVCLSKGLGAPVGSVLVGSSELMQRARIWRKRFGGGMRQVGILAAAGDYALTHHVARLADDHARARRLAEALSEFKVVNPDRVPTNLVLLDLSEMSIDAPSLVAEAAKRDVHISAMLPHLARIIFHLDVDDDGLDRTIKVLSEILRGGR
jgi:threonine aldolase